MKNIYQKGSLKMPDIKFDYLNGLMEMKGRSTPENTDELYAPLIDWFRQYVNTPQKKTTINIRFEYFNSRSAKYLARLLEQVQTLVQQDYEYEINWFYDDDELKEGGQDLEEVLELKFNYLRISE